MAQPRRRAARSSSPTERVAGQPGTGGWLDAAPEERWRHGQDLEPPPMTRAAGQVANGVRRFYEAERIGNAALEAAHRFYRNYVEGVIGARDEPGRGSGDVHDAQLARVRAVAAHRAIAAVLGPDLTGFLVGFIVDDLSFAAMDRRFGSSGVATSDGGKEFRTTMLVLLCILPNLYRVADNRQRATPPARAATTTSHFAEAL